MDRLRDLRDKLAGGEITDEQKIAISTIIKTCKGADYKEESEKVHNNITVDLESLDEESREKLCEVVKI